ncbi:protein JOKA2-like isoform X2 [Phragmites australis]|uniref:protein JOKA2-like isoform X2 n=1 Tax=Phragmites australis TaxID=29695 RepID=UPI002D76D3DC|nr:protein JOKA2-like isoform X2 [Phragmites australis]
MSALWAAPRFHGLEKRDDAWNLVVKVKYGDTLKRFNACVNGPYFDHDLAALRLKIASAFKFSPDVEFILTYTDEDRDVVMLDDDNDLRDAAINQKLNPLRINVQLKSSKVGVPRTKQQASNSRSLRSTALEDQLAQVKSAIDDALKFVPEQVPAILAKLSHDLRSRAASSAPSLAELLDRFAKLMIPSSNVQPSSGPADGSSRSSCGGPQTSGNSKIKHDSAPMIGSASEPSDMQNSETSKALGLKSVLFENPVSKIEQAPLYPPIEDSLIFTSSGGRKSDCKGSADTEIKRKFDAHSKGKSVTFSVPPVSITSHVAPTQRYVPAQSLGENTLRYARNPAYMTYGSNGKVSGDMPSICPRPPALYPSPPAVHPYHMNFGAKGLINGDLCSTFPPPPNIYEPFKLNTPSVGTYFPYPEGIYSSGSSHRDDMPSSLSNYVPNPEGLNSFGSSYGDLSANYGSIPQHALHRWIQCDGCGVTPIVGPRYKSNVKEDYDLCGACFSHMGNESEYTRLDMPASKNIPPVKPDCHFIKDVTVPDGTPMAPSTPFTKIWRMQNSGATMWPFGTQLIWVGGDQFSCQSSVKLAISLNRGLPVGQVTDVAVDFLAPAKPGRYISYWRLALPSGQKFGQQVWVLIQVEQPIQTSSSKQAAAINLNLALEANSAKLKPSIIDMNSDPIVPFFGYSEKLKPFSININTDTTVPNFEYRFRESIKPKESEPAPSVMPSVPTAVQPVQIPITDASALSAGAALASVPAGVPATDAMSAPVSVPAPATAPVSVPAPATAPISVPAAPSNEIINHTEEKLLSELEHMGFMQADLNKEILRQNKYDLEQSVVDLCGFNEWDPLLGELSELGFDDAEMNKAVVESDDERIKLLATDLSSSAKDQ